MVIHASSALVHPPERAESQDGSNELDAGVNATLVRAWEDKKCMKRDMTWKLTTKSLAA